VPARFWAIIVAGAAVLVAGILLIVGEGLPEFVPDWDAEERLVIGLGIAAGGFCVAALGGLAGLTGLQSMGGRLEGARGRHLHGPVLAGCLLVAAAGAALAWYPDLRDWVPPVARLRPSYRLWFGVGTMAVAALAALLLGRRRLPAPRAPDPTYGAPRPPRPAPPGDFGT
jgi:hypothetical protein